MKKILAILFAAVMVLTVSASVYADTNIALLGTGISSNPDTTNTADKLVDGDTSTYSGSVANNDTMANGEYVGVLFDKTYTLDSVILHWGGGHPDTDGYKVEVTTDGENWTAITPTISREDVDNVHFNDTVTFATTTYATGIRFTTTKAMGKNSLQCWEIEAFGAEFEGEIPSDVSSEETSSEETPSDAVSSEIASTETSSEAVSSAQQTSSAVASQDEPAGDNDGSDTLTVVLAVVAVLVVIAVVAVIVIVKKKKA